MKSLIKVKMKTLIRVVCFIVLVLGVQALAQSVFNCSSFTSTGTCGFGSGQTFYVSGQGGGLSSGKMVLVPAGSNHNSYNIQYHQLVNIQAFTTTFTFVPNGYNLAFVIQNCNIGTTCGGQGNTFAAGAGGEGGFTQFEPAPNQWPNNLFALMLDQFSAETNTGSFDYSTAQIYQTLQAPYLPISCGSSCVPIYSTNKISTSPVPLNSPASTQGTTTGDTFSATITYTGSVLTFSMYDVTAGGTCTPISSGTCFSHSWNVFLPSIVQGNTANIGFANGVGAAPATDLTINSWSYTVNTPGSLPTTTNTTERSVANPTFSPAAGTYSSTQSVTISDTTPNAYVCYTLSSTPPTFLPQPDNNGGCNEGTLYTSPVSVSSTQTLYAMAGASIKNYPSGAENSTGLGPPSSIVSGTYTISPCLISAGASSATILSTISGCASGNTVTFAAGTYSLSNSANIPCGVSVAGPATSLTKYTAQDGYVKYGYLPTTIIDWTGSSPGVMFNYPGSCSTPATFSGIECNMNHPSPDGGQCLNVGSQTSNFTVSQFYFHGNQAPSGSSNTNDALMYVTGTTTDSFSSGNTISWGRFGATGDCSNIMSDNGNYSGSCAGLGIHTNEQNLTIANNNFYYDENGLKFYEGCTSGTGTCTAGSGMGKCLNCLITQNDFSNFHRIAFEEQANYPSSGGATVSITDSYNSAHDPFHPSSETFAFSIANGCQNTNPSITGCTAYTLGNTLIDNVATTGSFNGIGIEMFGSTGTYSNYNLVQGEWSNSISAALDGSEAANGNHVQSSFGSSGSNNPANCKLAVYASGNFGWFGWNAAPSQVGVNTPPAPTVANTCDFFDGSVQTSVAPGFSPNGSTFASSQTITLTCSLCVNQATNTTIWYTIDGSPPVPGSGTTQYYTGPFTVTNTTTVKSVGMWGALNQPLTYPTGPLSGTYGWQPSAVQSATFTKTGGGTVAPPGGPFVIVISKNIQPKL